MLYIWPNNDFCQKPCNYENMTRGILQRNDEFHNGYYWIRYWTSIWLAGYFDLRFDVSTVHADWRILWILGQERRLSS